MLLIRAGFAALALSLSAAALAQTGFVDPSFGGGFFNDTDCPWGPQCANGGYGVLYQIRIQSDNKVLAFGREANSANWGVLRFNPDGTPDATFGQGGTVTIPLSLLGANWTGLGIHDAAIQGDGKIVVVNDRFVLARLNPNGSLDTSFGSGGIVSITNKSGSDSIGFPSSAVAIGPGGKIIVAGTNQPGASTGADILIARLNANGTLDSTLGSRSAPGYFVDAQPGDQAPESKCLLVGSDGRMTVAARTASGMMLARYLSIGAPDASFGSGGRTTFAISSSADRIGGLEAMTDGRLIVGGLLNGGNGLFAARFSAAGALDSTFGGGGSSTLLFAAPQPGRSNVALQPDGGVVVGFNWTNPDSTADFAAWRVTASGTPDASFGPYGNGVSQLVGPAAFYSLAADALGRIVFVGSSSAVGPALEAIRGQ